MTCLFNNPAQFITITLGVFLGRFAYDLVALAVVRDKPEALAGSLRALPGVDRPGRGRHTLPVRQHRSRASAGPTIRSGTDSHPPTPGSSRDSSDVRSP
jgi:hypothetical protein